MSEEIEVDELWWEGPDMLIKTMDGKVFRYRNAYPMAQYEEGYEANSVSVQSLHLYSEPAGGSHEPGN